MPRHRVEVRFTGEEFIRTVEETAIRIAPGKQYAVGDNHPVKWSGNPGPHGIYNATIVCIIELSPSPPPENNCGLENRPSAASPDYEPQCSSAPAYQLLDPCTDNRPVTIRDLRQFTDSLEQKLQSMTTQLMHVSQVQSRFITAKPFLQFWSF